MKNLKHLLALLSLIFLSNILFAQLPYLEDFSGQDGKGVVGPNPNTYDTVGMDWTIDVSATNFLDADDYFKVKFLFSNELFEAQDTKEEVVWKSAIINIDGSGLVDLSVDLTEVGTMESTDYCNVYYILNENGTEVPFTNNGENSDDFTSITASEDAVSGTSVQIIIRIDNNSDVENHRFDNVSVTASTGYTVPSAGDLFITEFGRHSNASYGYLEIYNTTSSNLDLSSMKIVSDGSNDEVIDFGTDILGASSIPANGFLVLNRAASQSNFESTWSTITGNTISLASDVTYIRTDLNCFGNNNSFIIRVGGTADTDDGTLIEGSSLNASSNDKRVYQMPAGYWTNNLDNQSNATPGYLGANENITEVNLGYADGAWHAATGFGESAPSATTTTATAIVMRGQATIDDGSQLKKLTIMADAGTDLVNQIVVVSDEIVIDNDASLSITGTGSITSATGTITVKKEGYKLTTDYNMWGTPFSSDVDITSVFTNQFNCDVYAFEASSQSWKYDEDLAGSLNCSGNFYSMTAALGVSTTDDEGDPDGNFDVGRGYFIAGHTNNDIEFSKSTAVLNNGDITLKIFGSSSTPTDGSNDWNLISNPYPSSISVKDFLEGNNSTTMSNAVYLYNPGSGMNTSSSYDTYNTSHTTNYIASCQGFYVNGNTSTDGYAYDISFTNGMRHHTNNDFRSVLPFEGVYLDVVDANGENDPMRLYFDMEAEDGYDNKFDALKLPNGDFNFCTKLNNESLVFNGMSELGTEIRIIPLYFQTYQTSTFTINLDSLVGAFSNRDVLLEDRYMRTFHNIKQQGYSFSSGPKEWANRFYLHIIPKKANTGSGANGGGNTDTTTIVTGIENVDLDNLKVFFANNEIVVSSLSGKNNINTVQVIRSNGQVVNTTSGESSVVKISTIGFSSGIYFVRTTVSNGKVSVSQLVIQ